MSVRTSDTCRIPVVGAHMRKVLFPATPIPVASAGFVAVSGRSMGAHVRLPARVHEADGKGHLEHQLPTRDLQATRLVLGFGQENLRWVAERHLGHLGHAFLGQVARALSEWRTLAHDVGALVPEPRGGGRDRVLGRAR